MKGYIISLLRQSEVQLVGFHKYGQALEVANNALERSKHYDYPELIKESEDLIDLIQNKITEEQHMIKKKPWWKF